MSRSTASTVLEADVAARVVAERSLATTCAFAPSHDFAFKPSDVKKEIVDFFYITLPERL